MRKLLGSVLVLLMLAPALAVASPAPEPKALRAIDALWSDFSAPSWLDEQAPVPPITSGRAVTIPPAETQAAILKLVNSVSREYLLNYETKLQGFGSRYCRAPGMYNATQWLYEALLGNGRISSEFHNFTYTNGTGYTHTIRSVILTLPGQNTSSNRVYYVFNHADDTLSFPSPTYDQIMNNAPGADDDASGVAATLEAARVLSRFDFQDTLRFAFFNGEEIGLLGSYYWAQKMYGQGENIQGSIDFDMIGYSTGAGQYDLDLYSDPSSSWELQYLVGVNNRYNIGLRIYTEVTSQDLPSDITAFKYFGYPCAMGIEETFSPYYHTMQDRVEYLNMTLIARSTKLAVAAMAEMGRMLYVDVGVSGFDVSSTKPVEGENITLTANITNTGNLNATNLEVTFSADGFPFLSRRVDVPANGTNLTQAVWTARSGSHRLSVSLDPGNEIAEPVETNNTAEVDVAVNDRPRAVLSATPMSALTNETVEFNGSLSSDLSGGVAEYYFSFGDGNLSGWTASPVAYHSYPRNGFLTASLQVRDALGAVSDPTRLTIRVENRDPAAFPRSNATRALTFETVQFFSNASDPEGGVSLSWDFGDGSESSEKDPLHNYSKAGSYDVRLTVTDEDGASAASGLRVLIDDRPPACSIDAGRQSGTIEDEFVFTANASDPDGTISSWSWELGDGATSRSKQARHTYQRPGNYTVRLTVQDDAGSEARALAEVIVIDTPPEAKASLSAAQADTFKRVQFIGDRSGDLEGPVTFQWDFGDGNGSNEPSPYHAYSLPGDYNATLTVRDSAGQSSSITLPAVSIRNRQPKSDFRVFGCFTLNGTVYFDGTNSSDPEGPVTYSWDFGDGIRATGAVTEHVFTGAGSYSVNLTVTDTDGDSSILTQTVTVAAPPPPPPQPKKKPAVQDKTATVNALFGLSIILVVLLVAVAAWGVGRGKKRGPGPETVQMDTHPAPAPQAPDPAPPSYGGPPPGYRPPPQY